MLGNGTPSIVAIRIARPYWRDWRWPCRRCPIGRTAIQLVGKGGIRSTPTGFAARNTFLGCEYAIGRSRYRNARGGIRGKRVPSIILCRQESNVGCYIAVPRAKTKI